MADFIEIELHSIPIDREYFMELINQTELKYTWIEKKFIYDLQKIVSTIYQGDSPWKIHFDLFYDETIFRYTAPTINVDDTLTHERIYSTGSFVETIFGEDPTITAYYSTAIQWSQLPQNKVSDEMIVALNNEVFKQLLVSRSFGVSNYGFKLGKINPKLYHRL